MRPFSIRKPFSIYADGWRYISNEIKIIPLCEFTKNAGTLDDEVNSRHRYLKRIMNCVEFNNKQSRYGPFLTRCMYDSDEKHCHARVPDRPYNGGKKQSDSLEQDDRRVWGICLTGPRRLHVCPCVLGGRLVCWAYRVCYASSGSMHCLGNPLDLRMSVCGGLLSEACSGGTNPNARRHKSRQQ